MPKLNFHRIETLTFLLITLLGVANGQVTVFYIVYLFWFQELLRTLVDFFVIIRQKKTIAEKWQFLKMSFGSFFIMWIYFVFIVLLFGFMLNWYNSDLLGDNMLVLLFRNWYFNINLFLFLVEYIYFRTQTDNTKLKIYPFNPRHIILHISIILGAVIQLGVVPRLEIESKWTSALVILPFMLLKLWIDKPANNEKSL